MTADASTTIDNPSSEKVDFDAEYIERFRRLRAEAEAKGLKYEHPNRSGVGWKIHLPVSSDPNDLLTARISSFIDKKRLLFKVGKGGTTAEGKGMTIYVGDRDTMEDIAQDLNASFGDEIPEQQGIAQSEDTPVIRNIWARFDVYRDMRVQYPNGSTLGAKQKYHQWGPGGVPNLRVDAEKDAPWIPESERPSREERRIRAVEALTQDYGAFFTGTRGNPV